MKILLFFILSLSVFAEFSVVINNGTHGAKFDTLENANNWVSYHESKDRPWGYKKERSITLEISETPIPGYTSSEDYEISPMIPATEERVVINSEGKEVTIPATEEIPAVLGKIYHYPKEYTVEIRDLSNDAEYQKKLSDRNLILIGEKTMSFCQSVLKKVLGMNYGKTKEQIDFIETNYGLVLQKLNIYRPQEAYAELLKITPDGANVTQAEYDNIKSDFELFFSNI